MPEMWENPLATGHSRRPYLGTWAPRNVTREGQEPRGMASAEREPIGSGAEPPVVVRESGAESLILKALKRQGLSLELLYCAFHAIIVNKIMYAISAWYGFLNKSHVFANK